MKTMKNKDIEKILSNSSDLAPSKELKDKVIKECTPYIPEAKEKRSYFPLRRVMAFAAVFVFLFASLFSGLGLYNEKYESVYIDVNPSVELVVNRFNIINEVNYIGDDALQAYSNVKLKGKNIEDGLDVIMETLYNKGYFNEAEMYISVSSQRGEKAEKLLNNLVEKAEKNKKNKGYSVNINKEKFSNEEKSEAKKYNISPAKYKLIKEIIEYDDNYTMEDLKNNSMKNLKDIHGKGPGRKPNK